MNKTKPRISLFFPVYRDEHTVETVTRKAITVLSDVASEYEIIIIDWFVIARAVLDTSDRLAIES